MIGVKIKDGENNYMNDKDLIWEKYKIIFEAHRNVPNIKGERPILNILKNLENRYNNLEKIYNKIKTPSFKNELDDSAYFQGPTDIYNDIISYLRGIFSDYSSSKNFVPSILNALKYSNNNTNNIEYFQNLTRSILRWKEYKENIDFTLERTRDSEMSEIEKYVLSLVQIIEDFYNLTNRFMENAKESYKLRPNYSKGEWEYTLESTEEVYHASINAKEIYENGFDIKGKHGEGLGTGNQPREISFTIDLYVAKEIAKHFKVCWLIANDQYSWRDFINFLEDRRKDEYTVKEILHELWKNGYLNEQYKPNDRVQFLTAYTKCLIFLKDYYPAFMGTDYNKFFEKLKTIPYTNIGVLKCNIKTDGRSFKQSEMEIRAYPEDVLEITQFIK